VLGTRLDQRMFDQVTRQSLSAAAAMTLLGSFTPASTAVLANKLVLKPTSYKYSWKNTSTQVYCTTPPPHGPEQCFLLALLLLLALASAAALVAPLQYCTP
jgi:hypothetical protein